MENLQYSVMIVQSGLCLEIARKGNLVKPIMVSKSVLPSYMILRGKGTKHPGEGEVIKYRLPWLLQGTGVSGWVVTGYPHPTATASQWLRNLPTASY